MSLMCNPEVGKLTLSRGLYKDVYGQTIVSQYCSYHLLTHRNSRNRVYRIVFIFERKVSKHKIEILTPHETVGVNITSVRIKSYVYKFYSMVIRNVSSSTWHK